MAGQIWDDGKSTMVIKTPASNTDRYLRDVWGVDSKMVTTFTVSASEGLTYTEFVGFNEGTTETEERHIDWPKA